MTTLIGSKEITMTEVEKDLGILMDKELKFHKHAQFWS